MSAFFSSLFLEPVARRFSFPAWAGHQGDDYPAPPNRRPRISTLAQAPYHLSDDSQDHEAISLCLNEVRCPRTLTRHTRNPAFGARQRPSRASSCPNGPPYAVDEATKLYEGLTRAGNEALHSSLKNSGLRRAFASEANLSYAVEPARRRTSRKKRRRHPHVQPMQAASGPHAANEQTGGSQDERRIDACPSFPPAVEASARLRQNLDEQARWRSNVSDGSHPGDAVFNGGRAATRGRPSQTPTSALSSVAWIQQEHAAQSAISDSRFDGGLTSLRSGALDAFPHPGNLTPGTDGNTTLIGSLPANDGMRNLRRKMHEIRELAISTEEKARLMHALMMADYKGFKGFQHEQVHTPHSLHRGPLDPVSAEKCHHQPAPRRLNSTVNDMDSLQMIGPADFEPSYHPSGLGPESEDSESTSSSAKDETDPATPTLGCAHYQRNVKVQCIDCHHWYPCRHCHDDVEDHALVRKKVRNMLCMKCNCPQMAAAYCAQCQEQAAVYYCEICKLWDNDPAKKIYHCDDCGICRIGEGLGKDYLHCKRCNVCVSMNHVDNHRCVERATDCNCPICGDYMFTSTASIVAMRCGHYIHRKCYYAFMETAYKCPVCNRSAVNMELQWRKMDYSVTSQPMPKEYQETKAMILCNDCSARGLVPFHWLGNKCRSCDSYNTNQLHLVNAPGRDEVLVSAELTARADRQQPNADANDILGTSTLESQIPAAPLPAAIDSTPLVPNSDSMQNTASEPHLLPAVSALDVSAETENGATQSRAPISSPIPRAADPQPEQPRRSMNAESRPLTASNTDDEEDDASFWGESISPSRLVPSGWASPTLFASSSNDEETERASSLGSGNSGWPFDPRQWRIGSPFFGSRSAKSDDGETSIERKQEPDEDFEFYEEEEENGTFAWPINPSAWGLSGPGFFASSTKAEQPIETAHSTPAPAHIATGPVPSSWPINPSSLLEGFSGQRFLAAGNPTRTSLSTGPSVHAAAVGNPSQSAFASWGLNVPTPGLLLAGRLSGWSEGRMPLWNNELSTAKVEEQDEEDESSSEEEAGNDLEDDNCLEDDEEEEEELDLLGHR